MLGKYDAKLKALIQRSHSEFSNTGEYSLCIGFPLVQKYDTSSKKLLLCPLLLWKINIDIVDGRIVLQRSFEDPVCLNDSFCEFMRTDCDVYLRKNKNYWESKEIFNELDIKLSFPI